MVFCIDSNTAEDLVSTGHDWRVVLVLWTLAHEALEKDPPTQIAEHCKTAGKTTECESKLRKSLDQKKDPNIFLLWTETWHKVSNQRQLINTFFFSPKGSNLLMLENWLPAIHAKYTFRFFLIIHLQYCQYNTL